MVKRFHRMLEHLHVGCEAPRAYFVPFESGEKASLPRENSAFLTLLNGEWDFAFFKNVEELLLVKGIGKKKFAKLREMITVE